MFISQEQKLIWDVVMHSLLLPSMVCQVRGRKLHFNFVDITSKKGGHVHADNSKV